MRNLLNDDVCAILPAAFARLAQLAEGEFTTEGFDFEAAITPKRRQAGAVAVLPLYGVLERRPSLLAALLFGATSLEMWSAQFRRLVADEGVKAIVIDIDSPGGGVYGVQELADDIFAARERKPIVAVANSLAASGAYWLASQASEFVASPSSQVGSIGVFAMHADLSKALEDFGIKVRLISAGKYKTEGNPYEPLSEEAEAAIQERVNEYYTSFVSSVARGRGVSAADVRGGFGEGRVLGVKEAKRQGMIDRVATLAQTVQRLGGTVDGMGEMVAEEMGAEIEAVELNGGGQSETVEAPEPNEAASGPSVDTRKRRLRLVS